MKKWNMATLAPINLAVSFIFFSLTIGLLAQSKSGSSFYTGGHDSLLFDGSGTSTYFNISKCTVKAQYVSGDVEAFVMETNIVSICGQKDTMVEFKKKKVKVGDILELGDLITTGPDGKIALGLPDGSEMKLGHNSKVMIPSNYCEEPSGLKFFFGHMWINVKKQLGKNKYEIKTRNWEGMNVIGVRGTTFSVEIKLDNSDTIDIIRVYEGSVEVYPSTKNLSTKSQDDAKAYQKLTEDYQAGKITIEEMIKKSQEYQENITKLSEEMKSKMCEAGYMVKVTDKISDPVPIESGSNWFDDANFKK